MFTQILVPLDGSEYAERALVYARDLATNAGARVSLVSVLTAVKSPVGPAPDEPEEHRGRPWLTYLEERAEAVRGEGVAEVSTQVRFGEPARMITELARELHADLIVMSTEGLGADGRYALGSVALKVLMTAPCPVLMVRINRPESPRTPAEERWQTEGGANVG